MKKLIIIFLIFLVGQNMSYAQDYIQELKNGALLVRIPSTNQHKLKYLIAKGDTMKMLEEIEETQKYYENIVEAFNTEWSFCPVYFFWSDKTSEIKKGNLNNVYDFRGFLHPLTKQQKEQIKNNYLIAYIGETQGNLKFNSLILSNPELIQLKKPYPRYVRTYSGLSFLQRELNKTVRILNKKIEWHYSRIQ